VVVNEAVECMTVEKAWYLHARIKFAGGKCHFFGA